jgi:hypothetical protein
MLAEDEHIARNFLQMRFQPAAGQKRPGAAPAGKRPQGPVQGTDSPPDIPPLTGEPSAG